MRWLGTPSGTRSGQRWSGADRTARDTAFSKRGQPWLVKAST
jgi:hypothetical protein